tara:strand:+ start:67 stop:306 length:240 start_codon:yes stop_codon:yes gene_type:complete
MNIDFAQETWRLVDVHCDGKHPGERYPWFDDLSTLDHFLIVCEAVALLHHINYFIARYKKHASCKGWVPDGLAGFSRDL